MCRAEPHGRRCPGDTGAKRRARQRAAYARKKQERLDAAGGAGGPGGGSGDGAAADPRQTAVQDCVSAFRGGPASVHDYSRSVRKLGALVAADADERAATRIVEAGLDPASIERWRTETVAAMDAAENASWEAKAERVKLEDRRDEIAPEEYQVLHDAVDELVAQREREFADLRQEGATRAQEMEQQRAAIRREAYLDALRASGVEFDGGPMPEPLNKLTRKDAAMMGEVIGNYPNAFVEHAEANALAATWKRTKGRAYHFRKKSLKKQIKFSHIPVHERNEDGTITINRQVMSDMAILEHPEILGIGVRDNGVPDTPGNREQLQAAVDEYNADPPPERDRYGVQNFEATRGPLVVDKYTDPDTGEKMIVARYTKQKRRLAHMGYSAELTFSDRSSMTHEYGHRIETANPEISSACKAFLYERTEGLPEEVYYKDEVCIPDGFADRYMGKDYQGRPTTEIFTTGMEAVMCGRFGGLIGEAPIRPPSLRSTETLEKLFPTPKADPEHRDLILGLLAMPKVTPETTEKDEN